MLISLCEWNLFILLILGLHAEKLPEQSARPVMLGEVLLRKEKKEVALRDCRKQQKWILGAKTHYDFLKREDHKLILKCIDLPNLKISGEDPWISAFQYLSFLLSARLQCSDAHLS